MPFTNAERRKNYRNRKKAPKIKKPPKTSTERTRLHRWRKKQLAQGSKLSANEVLYTPSTSISQTIYEPSPQPFTTGIDTSNVRPQIKEERENPKNNLDIEIEIPSLKLNMEMEHENEIKEEIKIEENNLQCRICLSVGRRMFPLEECEEIYKKLLFDNYQYREENWFSTVQVCWECHAILKSVDRFQRKVRTAHDMLQSHQNDVSLSTLTTVVFSDSIPDPIYPMETDKQTGQINSEIDTDENSEDNELLIDREKIKDKLTRKTNIVTTESKFKVIEGVESFRRIDFDLDIVKEVLDERKNEESYKRSRFKCSTCILSFDNKNELNEHNRECHDEKIGTHVCDLCQCRFSESVQLISHSRSHCSEFYCRLCSYRCSSEEDRDRHGRTHQSAIECLECGQLFEHRRQFHKHYKESHATFTCYHCGLIFKMMSALVEHISKKHKKTERKVCDDKGFQGPSSEFAYCVQCDLKLSDNESYKWHLANSVRHNPNNTSVRFSCPRCDKTFTKKIYLKNHYALFHLKLIKFKCVDCEKYFGRNGDLTRHRRQFHDDVPPPKN
ncbi:unnamed protein product [Euphydryas editha]|uniref:C2H2-type domain-containing protein n=1 Tax=Euphydryas editha TaxID=104508 RepID=A0AAU9T9N6_EUPED|nr:unnamed protein product [Euphydryas editha]